MARSRPECRPAARFANLRAMIPSSWRHAVRACVLALAMLPLAACDRGPVEWTEGTSRQELGDTTRPWRLTANGVQRDVTQDAVPPADYQGRACPGSLRIAVERDARGRTLAAAVWWSIRPDSSARLVSAMSADLGRTWSPPVMVDSLDRSGRGCARPAPAVAFESRSGYVHVAYFLEAVEGPGVFFAHSMDEGQLFHAPVPIVYGERPSRVAIAASGDTVVVVYEDPNARQPAIGLALSRTQGHLFERKAITASPPAAPAREPQVSIAGRTLQVAWVERPPGDAPPAIVVRRGEIREGALGD